MPPFHHASSDCTFQPPQWNCGSTCSTTSSPVQARREVEAEVRPEAVRVREHARPSASRSCRTCRSGAARRRRRPRRRPASRRRAGGASGSNAQPVAAASAVVLVLDEEARTARRRRAGSASSGAREPPVERQQHEAGLRAGEEDDHVLGRVAGQRRDAVAATQPAREQLARRARPSARRAPRRSTSRPR